MSPEEGNIFLVEDDSDARTLLGMILRRKGFNLVIATNKREALDRIQTLGEEGVGAALLDANLSPSSLGGSDGAEVYAAIREQYGDRIRIAGISASDPIVGADIPMMTIDDLPRFYEELEQL